MADLILPGQQLSIPQMMGSALAPFRLRDQLHEAFEIAHQSRELVKVDERVLKDQPKKLVALQRATTNEARWQLYCKAHDAIDLMPSGEVLQGHFNSLKLAINTKPSDQDLGLLLGKFVDVLQIRPGGQTDDYVELLAWKLTECPRQPHETYFQRRKPWMPVPAIAATINHFWESYKANYGRPPDIPDVLKECSRRCERLFEVLDGIGHLVRTQARLAFIVKATSTSTPPPEDDWD
jgi:hypothetical protein